MTAADILIAVGLLVFLAGELVALSDTEPDNTLSARVRAWVRKSVRRKALLVGGMTLLLTHFIWGFPW